MKKETIKQAVAPYMAELTKMADRIYDLAEPGLEEVRSSDSRDEFLPSLYLHLFLHGGIVCKRNWYHSIPFLKLQ